MSSRRMEHRLFQRHESDHPVAIFRDGRRIGQARVRNVNRAGAMLEVTVADTPLPDRGRLELEIERREPSAAPRLAGMVIHRANSRLGVMFLEDWNRSEWELLASGSPAAPLNPVRAALPPERTGTAD